MKLYLDEEQQSHLYSCLLAGGKVWANMKKGLEKLERPTIEVDRELELNAALRMQLNPKAEEIARARERKDPAQQDFTAGEGLPSSGETGGGHRPGEVVRLKLYGDDVAPTDNHVRDALLKYDRMVLLSDIAGWTSSERDSVMRWVNEFQAFTDSSADIKPEPEEPECLALVAMSQESVESWNVRGPYVIVEMLDGKQIDPASEHEPTSFVVQIPGDGTFDAVVAIDTTDGVEAEVKQARANRAVAAKDDMDEAQIEGWLHAGPWKIEGEGELLDLGDDPESPTLEVSVPTRWYISHEESDQRQRVIDEATARATAAKYNRNFAGKDENNEWRQPPAPPAAGDLPEDDDEDGGWMTHKDDSEDLWETTDETDDDEAEG